jgi:hypothetical protein
MSAVPVSESAQPRPALALREAVAIIVGIVVGAGIVKVPSLVAQFTSSPGWMLATWVAGGALSLMGALCHAELAAGRSANRVEPCCAAMLAYDDPMAATRTGDGRGRSET